MTVARLAISLDQDLARAVRKSAGKQPTSAWMADAARAKLRNEGLLRVTAEYQTEFGSFTEDELREVGRREAVAIRAAKRAAARRRARRAR